MPDVATVISGEKLTEVTKDVLGFFLPSTAALMRNEASESQTTINGRGYRNVSQPPVPFCDSLIKSRFYSKLLIAGGLQKVLALPDITRELPLAPLRSTLLKQNQINDQNF